METIILIQLFYIEPNQLQKKINEINIFVNFLKLISEEINVNKVLYFLLNYHILVFRPFY